MRGALRTWWHRSRAWRLDETAQASTEYAMTSTIILIGAVGAAGSWPFFSTLMRALDHYLASIHFILNTPFP